MPTPFVRYSQMTVQETLTAINKSGELIQRFLSKVISEMDLFTDSMLFPCFYRNKKYTLETARFDVE